MPGFENLHLALRDLRQHLGAASARGGARPIAMPERLPRLTSALARADELRKRRISRRREGARFRGLDELLRDLDDLRTLFDEDTSLCSLTFVIDRCIADFQTAVESILSGIPLGRDGRDARRHGDREPGVGLCP